jgi:hypothetical protein
MHSSNRYSTTLNNRYCWPQQPGLLSCRIVEHSLAALSLGEHPGAAGNIRTLGLQRHVKALAPRLAPTLAYNLQRTSARVPCQQTQTYASAGMTQSVGGWQLSPSYCAHWAAANFLRTMRPVAPAPWTFEPAIPLQAASVGAIRQPITAPDAERCRHGRGDESPMPEGRGMDPGYMTGPLARGPAYSPDTHGPP